MAVTVRSLGSGSSGNALLIESKTTSLLIDCGIGSRALQNGLSLAKSPLTALLVTHEHVDHIRSLEWVAKRGVPVVATSGTARAASVARSSLAAATVGRQLNLDGLDILPLAVQHDAAEPCGFYIELADIRITVLTDLGSTDDSLLEPISQSDLIVLEANHDETMLRRGPYPAHLKQRVLSSVGHLSNVHCGDLLARSLSARSRPATIWLAHLSQVNNTPTVATQTVESILMNKVERFNVSPMPRYGSDLTWRSDQPFVPVARDYQLLLPGI